jgi:hypothetical protein
LNDGQPERAIYEYLLETYKNIKSFECVDNIDLNTENILYSQNNKKMISESEFIEYIERAVFLLKTPLGIEI